MDVERAFEGLGVDAITGSKLMDWLGVSSDELQSPQRFARLQTIIGFLKQFPEDTQRFLVTKATRGKLVDKLDHMFEYVHLLKRKEETEGEIKNIEKERSAVELAGEPLLATEVARRSIEARDELGKIREEITIYEK